MLKALFVCVFCLIHGCASAAQQARQVRDGGERGLSLGTVYFSSVERFSPYMQVFDRYLTLGIGISSDKSQSEASKRDSGFFYPKIFSHNCIDFTGHIGLRGKLFYGFYLHTGVSGIFMWDRDHSAYNRYSCGPYLGSDMVFFKHIMLSAQLVRPFFRTAPTEWSAQGIRLPNWEGVLGLSYLF